MSPYLFVLCMERLGQFINQAVVEGLRKPIKLSHYGPPLSHLFLIDDLLLFAKASKEQIKIIVNCLNNLCATSGQKISLHKSTIAFSSGVDKVIAQKISNILRISIKPHLEKYLGIPSIMGRVNLGTFQYLLDWIEGRLKEWKSKYLTFAGRLVLVKSVHTLAYISM